ncbi:MAG: PhnD/SsuA/transferrin family substrate-binding protein [Verrucomicrobia bacterium]|nr:PhnD/SsuA/transferrin family substrate-binding protein [Verrucomicrobiota bacterium]
MNSAMNWVWPWLLAAVLARSDPAQTAQSLSNRTQADLTVGFAKKAFAGMNRNDVEASFKAFLVTVGRRRGFDLVVRTLVFEDSLDFEAAIRSAKVHIGIVPSWDYVTMHLSGFADPGFVAVDQQGILSEYLVLARREGGPRSLADLRGQSIVVLESVNTYSSWPWLQTLLLERQFGTPETFFGTVEKVAKPSGAVLPVFFGNHAACIVDRAAFDIMNELNPQIGQRLQVVLVSPPLLDAVICLNRSGWIAPEHREAASLGLAEFDAEPQGQQILALFKVHKFVPFKPEYLDNMRKLRAEYDRLAKPAAHDSDRSSRPSNDRRSAP